MYCKHYYYINNNLLFSVLLQKQFSTFPAVTFYLAGLLLWDYSHMSVFGNVAHKHNESFSLGEIHWEQI